MRFSESSAGAGNLIQGYGPEGVRIGGQVYRGGLIVSAGQIIPNWGPADAADLDLAHLEALIDLAPEVIVLGSGARQCFPSPALYRALLELRIGFEVMTTGAACRTYNVLLSEGRQVVAALLPP